MSEPKDFSQNANSNNSVGSVNIAENQSQTATMDNALRAMLAAFGSADKAPDWGPRNPAALIDHIAESTTNVGVTIDGVLLKDGKVPSIEEGGTQGAILYFNSAGNLTRFPPSATVGDALLSGGPGADPSWGPAQSNAPTQQTFTTSGTWTKPTGCRAVVVEVQGPGGGGAGSGTTANVTGGGGSGGGYARKLIDVTSIASATITIGTGGSGAGSSTDGQPGSGPSIWSDGTNTLTANEGKGGNAGNTSRVRKTGGTATGGDINIQGGSGAPNGGTSIGILDGSGGNSQMGSGGFAQENTDGEAGTGYGSGGSGGHNGGSANRGGDGANGIVTVLEYY